ncbi:MAG TPA: FkbM family methyltransferase [Candidatus Angelobacter sp.]|nr:FkbM family methyltransferase [Candidatus Angelobacter sp.]
MPVPVIRMVSSTGARFPWLKRRMNWYRDSLRNQEGTIQRGVGKGLRFNAGPSNVGFLLGSADRDVQSAMQTVARSGQVVYDIGANVGFFTVIAARLVGPSGRVVSFEPLEANFLLLRHNAQLNGFTHVVANNFALADRDGTAEFLLSKDPTFGGLASSAKEVDNQAGKTEVRVFRLDSVVQRDSLPLPGIMKIDVEGAEAAVLDGAAETIRKARPILIIELHGTNAAISGRLKALGYFPVVPGGTDGVTEAHWNAQVVAFPAPCPELTELQNSRWGN